MKAKKAKINKAVTKVGNNFGVKFTKFFCWKCENRLAGFASSAQEEQCRKCGENNLKMKEI